MPHYYSEKQQDEFNPELISIKSKTDEFKLYSASGVFSRQHLDNASDLLIQAALELGIQEQRILDIGCGYGVIGISLLRKISSIQVDFSDVSERALKLTRMNLKYHKFNGRIKKSDGFEKIQEKYNLILSNPPLSAGRKKSLAIISNSKNHLHPEGKLMVVARHAKGGKFLKAHMEEVFGNVSDIKRGSGFHVYMSINE